jgi:hypothetical protein
VPRIENVYAFVIADADGELHEGIVMTGLAGCAMPMIASDATNLPMLREAVLADPTLRGKRIVLVRYGDREDLDVIDRSRERPPWTEPGDSHR